MKIPKIAIIGTGAVGAHIAFSLALSRVRADLFLIDKNEDLEEGQYLDLMDISAFSEVNCKRGDMPDAADADIIIITAGTAQRPGETRTDLIGRNMSILRSIKSEIGNIQKNAIVIMVANPVDILTYVASEELGLPYGQVFGTGTLLDTSRLKWHIGNRLDIHSSSIQAYVIGEHGQTEFVPWSICNVQSKSCKDLFNEHELDQMEEEARSEAYKIIEKKGATYFGIAVCTTEIVASVLGDEKKIFPVSVPLKGEYNIQGMALGVPCVISAKGIEKVMKLELNKEEQAKLQNSAEALKKILKDAS
jgi:L-lactate dehydrogenase